MTKSMENLQPSDVTGTVHQEVPDAGESTCPMCGRRWVVTVFDDCLLPSCGCYGTDTTAANLNRPCHRCGMAHALRHRSHK